MADYAIVSDYFPVPNTYFSSFLYKNLNKRICNLFFSSKHRICFERLLISENAHPIFLFRANINRHFLKNASEALLYKSLERLEYALNFSGINFVYVSPALQYNNIVENYLQTHGFNVFDGMSVCDYFVPQLIPARSLQHIGIWTALLDMRAYMTVKRLSSLTKYITVFTDSPLISNDFADNIYAETGLSISITNELFFNNCSALLLLSEKPTLKHLSTNCLVIPLNKGCNQPELWIEFKNSVNASSLSSLTGLPLTFDFIEFLLSSQGINLNNEKEFKKSADSYFTGIKKGKGRDFSTSA